MNWPRLLEIITMAMGRVGNGKVRGGDWHCYCLVCSELRKLAL